VRESRGLSEGDARARMANQSPQAVKVAAADVLIDGSAPIEETRRQVTDALERLLAS
jgi:dephospho-CoA kinase